ncbi:MAG: hypothetical protein CM15mP13_3230 [Pseudomonadota bacterium]|nr:MAG: hypothetical protein CM15mP13_3230 [Pseudomonadota bacterium]
MDFLRPLDYQNLLSRLIEENIELKNGKLC